MLSTLRKRVRMVMIIVAAAFIAGFLMSELWSMLGSRRPRGPQNSGQVGRVGKKAITYEEYRSAVAYMTDKYKTENQIRDLSNEDYSSIEQQAWRFIVSELTWAKVLKDARIQVTQDEVFEIMKANPPEQLRDDTALMTDGKFDQEKYMRVMNAPENRSVFTKYFRDLVEMLPKEKFRIDVMAAYRVTNGEAEEGARTRETRWQATGLLFGSQAVLQKLEPGEAELKAYYEKNKEDYRTKETRDLGYVSFPIVVTARDSQDAKEVIDKAHNQLAAGETFNITALDFSELELDSSGRFFAKARLDPATDTIVSRLKPGTYSSPFLTNYGWQIVMLDSTRPDSIALRRILVRVKQGAEELAALRDSVRNFIDRARTGNFDTVAAEFGLSVIRTRPMVGGEGNFSALGLESPSALTEWAKRARRGDVMESPVRGQPGYMVFHLVDIKPAGFQEYEKVKPAVSWKVRQEQEKAVWSARAESAWIQVKAGKTMEQVAQEMPGVEFFAGEDYGSLQDARMRRGAEFAGALSVLNPGEKTGVVTTAWGAYIIRCDERVAGAAANPGAFAQERQQQVAQQLMQELLKEPEVADYRDGFSY